MIKCKDHRWPFFTVLDFLLLQKNKMRPGENPKTSARVRYHRTFILLDSVNNLNQRTKSKQQPEPPVKKDGSENAKRDEGVNWILEPGQETLDSIQLINRQRRPVREVQIAEADEAGKTLPRRKSDLKHSSSTTV